MPVHCETHPRVSIIVPVFNGEPFLDECLASILAQTIRAIEIICINDGSTDQSLEILDKCAKTDARIKVIDNSNEGVSVARNVGVAHAIGDYLMFVDADDWVEPDFCEVPYEAAQLAHADIVSFNYCRSSERWQRGTGKVWDSLPDQNAPHAVMKSIAEMLVQVSVTPVTKIWSRTFWQTHQLSFPVGLGMGEDQYVHWLGLLEARRVIHIDQAFYHYRTNLASATNNGGAQCIDIIGVYALIESYLRKTAQYNTFVSPFLYAKLTMFRLCYLKSSPEIHLQFAQRLLAALTVEDWDAIRGSTLLPSHIRNFYKAVSGDFSAKLLEKGIAFCRVIRDRFR